MTWRLVTQKHGSETSDVTYPWLCLHAYQLCAPLLIHLSNELYPFAYITIPLPVCISRWAVGGRARGGSSALTSTFRWRTTMLLRWDTYSHECILMIRAISCYIWTILLHRATKDRWKWQSFLSCSWVSGKLKVSIWCNKYICISCKLYRNERCLWIYECQHLK